MQGQYTSSFLEKVLRPFPHDPALTKFLNLELPPSFEFALQKSKVDGIKLVTHAYPQYLNKFASEGTPAVKLTRHKQNVCVMKGKDLLIGNKKLRLQGISCFAYNSSFLLVAFENRNLSIYGEDLKLLKEISNFSGEPLNEMHIVTIYSKVDAIVLLTTSGSDVTVRRIEKSFFSSWVCKYTRQVSIAAEPYMSFVEPSKKLKQTYLQGEYSTSTLVGCISSSQITLLRISGSQAMSQNFVSTLFTKSYINPSSICHTSWGETTIKNNQSYSEGTSIVLTYSMGKEIYQLVPIKQSAPNSNEVRTIWHESQPLLNDKVVAFCQYLYEHELLVVHEDGSTNLYYTEKTDWLENTKQYDVLSYEFPQKPKPYVLYREKPQMKTYSPIMFYEPSTQQIYYLQTTEIGVYQLCSWSKLCQKLKQQGNYEGIMKLLAAIYLKTNKYSFKFRRTEKEMKQLSQCIQKTATEYLYIRFPKHSEVKEEELLQRMESEEWMKEELTIPMELLVRTQEFDFLFGAFKASMQQYISQKVFFKSLQVFINYGMIKYIPEELIRSVFNFYLTNKQPHIVERLAVGFDLSLIQKEIVIHYCLQNVLVSSLAYICTQGTESEFITPLVKFYGLAEANRLKNDVSQARLFAKHMLWYVDLCLHKDLVTLKGCSQEKFGNLVSLLTTHLFSQNVATTLLLLNLKQCLNTMSSYFTLENAILVAEYCTLKVVLENAEWINSIPSRATLEAILSVIDKGIENCISRTQSQEEKSEYEKMFVLFLSKIIVNKTIKFKKPKYLQILEFLIKDYESIKLINYGYDTQIQTSDPTQEISQYINKVLMQSMNQVSINSSDLSSLQKLAAGSRLIEVEVYINYVGGNYGRALDVYLNQNSDLVFDFILSTFKLLGLEKRKKDKKVFEDQVKKRISSLAVLNPSKATNIAKVHFPESQDQLIQALEGKQSLQLEYLENLVSSRSHLSQKSVLLFVRLMCSLKPAYLLMILKRNPIFPIQATLKICQKYKVFDCLEYLYDKMGLSNQSILVAINRVQEYITVNPTFSLYDSEQVSNIIQNTITLCIKNKSQELWQLLFDSVIILSGRYSGEWKELFETTSSKVFCQLLVHCPIDYCIRLLQSKYNTLPLTKKMSLVFLSLFRNYLYNENMMYYAIDYEKAKICYFNADYYVETYKGCLVNLMCENCSQCIDRSKHCLAFRCGHSYHKECTVRDDFSYVCLKCLDKQPSDFQLPCGSSSPTRRPKPNSNKLLQQAKQLKEVMMRKFSQQQTQYSQQQLDNQKEQVVKTMLQKLDSYEDVREAADEISNNVLERLERSAVYNQAQRQ